MGIGELTRRRYATLKGVGSFGEAIGSESLAQRIMRVGFFLHEGFP
ncbi:hypothetical protein MICAH_40008 [Microcystis aeruginosa PCC 9809]|uniref:Uncharacterized protein n=1 Tax=Microcystis aeruginosa PCC 9809 TaxID=1160285 RepID=I4HWS6_MICAE|nr:hypothetical protein MICAH_40008 [Microcystis aeruginosa PCC 9809]